MDSGELQSRLVDFAVSVGIITDMLPHTRFGRQIAGQLVRCGTSPMANYAEACGSESKRDFIHKLSICLKEIRESGVWLTLIQRAKLLSDIDLSEVRSESDQLRRILGKSITTARSRS